MTATNNTLVSFIKRSEIVPCRSTVLYKVIESAGNDSCEIQDNYHSHRPMRWSLQWDTSFTRFEYHQSPLFFHHLLCETIIIIISRMMTQYYVNTPV